MILWHMIFLLGGWENRRFANPWSWPCWGCPSLLGATVTLVVLSEWAGESKGWRHSGQRWSAVCWCRDVNTPVTRTIVVMECYPLVNVQKTMENHNCSWENPLFLWAFSIAMLNYQKVWKNDMLIWWCSYIFVAQISACSVNFWKIYVVTVV